MFVVDVVVDHLGQEVSRSIRRVEDGAAIPEDLSNRDYQQFLEWDAEDGPAVENVAVMPAPPPPSLQSADGRVWQIAAVDGSGVPQLIEVVEDA